MSDLEKSINKIVNRLHAGTTDESIRWRLSMDDAFRAFAAAIQSEGKCCVCCPNGNPTKCNAGMKCRVHEPTPELPLEVREKIGVIQHLFGVAYSDLESLAHLCLSMRAK